MTAPLLNAVLRSSCARFPLAWFGYRRSRYRCNTATIVDVAFSMTSTFDPKYEVDLNGGCLLAVFT
jgi:hypothetical protein